MISTINAFLLLRAARWPVFGRKEKRAVLRVLRSGNWGGAPSPNTCAAAFAQRFASFHNARFGICTTSGYTALAVAYRAAGLRQGDEIIVPALTFSATAAAALDQGIRPIFADVDVRTMCIDPRCVEHAITERTKAVVAVHLGAHMTDMDALQELCGSRRLLLIEDCAHAHGARWRGRGAGSLGQLGCFSFQSSKLMTAGEGGIIITDDPELAARCHSCIDCGRPTRDGDAAQTFLGANYRMTEFQAALLLAQLDRLPAQTEKRQKNVRLLGHALGKIEGIEVLTPYEPLSVQAVYGYYFRYLGEERYDVPLGRFVRDLQAQGFPVLSDMYRPVYQSPEYGWRDACAELLPPSRRCPVAEHAASKELVWIPHGVFLAPSRHITRLAQTISALLCEYRSRNSTRPAARG